jgi:hypothetical protein
MALNHALPAAAGDEKILESNSTEMASFGDCSYL